MPLISKLPSLDLKKVQNNPMLSNHHGGGLGMNPMMFIDQNRLLAQQQLQQQLQQQQMMQHQQIQLAALNNQVMMGNPLIVNSLEFAESKIIF